MLKSFLIIFVLSTLAFVCQANANTCQDWFDKITIKNDCESDCRTSKIDMSSYLCRNECEKFCKNQDDIIKKYDLLIQYGLSKDEILLCNNNKILCVNAYKLSWKTENICLTLYNKSKINDESDACRHFTWALLLAQNLGSELAEKILTAHENNIDSTPEARAMDLSNNRLALLVFQQSKNKLTELDILDLFQSNLKNNKLVVLTPDNKNRKPK
jgi:hypothetical protein